MKTSKQKIQSSQTLHKRVIAKIVDAPHYVINDLLLKDFNIKTVSETATEFYKNFHQSLTTSTY